MRSDLAGELSDFRREVSPRLYPRLRSQSCPTMPDQLLGYMRLGQVVKTARAAQQMSHCCLTEGSLSRRTPVHMWRRRGFCNGTLGPARDKALTVLALCVKCTRSGCWSRTGGHMPPVLAEALLSLPRRPSRVLSGSASSSTTASQTFPPYSLALIRTPVPQETCLSVCLLQLLSTTCICPQVRSFFLSDTHTCTPLHPRTSPRFLFFGRSTSWAPCAHPGEGRPGHGVKRDRCPSRRGRSTKRRAPGSLGAFFSFRAALPGCGP